MTDVGLAHRAIYNSINGSIMPESIEALKNSDVDAAIVLAFNPADPSVAGREKVLDEGGVAGQTKGMLEIAEYCGIKRPILDTAATPLGLGSGGSYREILACKAIHGYPTGGAYHNMTVSWTWLKRWKGTSKDPLRTRRQDTRARMSSSSRCPTTTSAVLRASSRQHGQHPISAAT